MGHLEPPSLEARRCRLTQAEKDLHLKTKLGNATDLDVQKAAHSRECINELYKRKEHFLELKVAHAIRVAKAGAKARRLAQWNRQKRIK